jgi:hypothetical protein
MHPTVRRGSRVRTRNRCRDSCRCMGRRVVECSLLGIGDRGILLGKVDLDQYPRTAGKEVDYTPSRPKGWIEQKVDSDQRLTLGLERKTRLK